MVDILDPLTARKEYNHNTIHIYLTLTFRYSSLLPDYSVSCFTPFFYYTLTFTFCGEVPHDLCPLSVCSLSLSHSLHLNPVSGARLEGGQSVGGVTVSRLIGIDGAILGGVGHSEGVALGVAS